MTCAPEGHEAPLPFPPLEKGMMRNDREKPTDSADLHDMRFFLPVVHLVRVRMEVTEDSNDGTVNEQCP